MAWTAGSLAGNQAYYSTRKQQSIEREIGELSHLHRKSTPDQVQHTVTELAEEYLNYREYGGEFPVRQWLEEMQRDKSLSDEEAAIRYLVVRFRARSLSDEEAAKYIRLHLCIFSCVDSPQYRAIGSSKDFLPNEKLYPIWNAFAVQLREDGLSEQDAMAEGLTRLFLSNARLQEFGDYLLANAPRNQSSPPTKQTASRATKFPDSLYVARGSETHGPYTYTQLLGLLGNDSISLEDLVAYEDAPSWITVYEFMTKVESDDPETH